MRIGLAGCGRWGRLILRDLISLGAEVAVADILETRRADALMVGAVSTHDGIEALPAVDAYVVAVPTVLHSHALEVLIPRGCPIFVEKPMTCNADDAARIVTVAPDRVFCMDKWRYHGGVLKLAELAKSGALGEVLSVRSWRLGWGNPHDDVDATWILAPHDLSIAYEILGFLPEVRAAFGLSSDPIGTSLTGLLQDNEGGPSAVMEISASHPVNRRSVVVIGTEGAAQFGDSFDSVVRVNRPGKEPEEMPVSTEMPLLAELGAFLDHVKGGPPPKSSAAEAALFVRRIAEMRAIAGFE